ncbi:hypothetical protein ACFLS7_01845 [Bacteroidota bacterium]
MKNGIFELGQINFPDGLMFKGGTLYFNQICSDTTYLQCSNWELGGYIYLIKQYGFIKMEYTELSDSSNIQSQVLFTINFP